MIWTHVYESLSTGFEPTLSATNAFARGAISEADALDEKDRKPDYERRKALRQEKAYPEIRKFETWMEVNIVKCGPKSLMEEAISYTYRILKKLSIYTTDGRYKIDDNMVENSIRPLAIRS